MRYGDGGTFRQALKQRLKTLAGEDRARLARNRNRKRVAFDRLLARLATIAPDSWLLKGGFALDLRLAERARATKDVDPEARASNRYHLREPPHRSTAVVPAASAGGVAHPVRQLAHAVGVADDLEAGHATAAGLLDPILSGEIRRGCSAPRRAAVDH